MINTGEVIPDTFPSNTVPTAQMWKKGGNLSFLSKKIRARCMKGDFVSMLHPNATSLGVWCNYSQLSVLMESFNTLCADFGDCRITSSSVDKPFGPS